MKYYLISTLLIMTSICGLFAQDLRARHYYYEILTPSHEAKPVVVGYAAERGTEKLNGGTDMGYRSQDLSCG